MKHNEQTLNLFYPRFSLAAWRSFLLQCRRWIELSRQRHQLANLDVGALRDIGISREQALLESQRPFWDDPIDK